MIREFLRDKVLFWAGVVASLAWPLALMLAWLSLSATPMSTLALLAFGTAVVASVLVFALGLAMIIAEPILRRRRSELSATWSPTPIVEDDPWSAAVADVPDNLRDIRWYREVQPGEVQ